MTNEKDLIQITRDAFSDQVIPEGPGEELIAQTLERIAREEAKPNHPFLERNQIMKSISKFAVAAIFIFGVFFTINLINQEPVSLALADVLSRVKTVSVFFYQMQMTTTGEIPGATSDCSQAETPMDMKGSIWVSNDTGKMKMEMTINGQLAQRTYMDPQNKRMINLMPPGKAYMEMELTNTDMLENQKKSNDPRHMIKQLMEAEHTSLGRAVVNGIETEVIESNDPKIAGGMFGELSAKLWLDVETGYPVQWEMTMSMNEGKSQVHMLAYDFQWDAQIDPAELEAVIPEDYQSIGKVQIPAMDEATAIEGLRKYVEIADSYPESLNLMDLMQKANKLWIEANPEFRERKKKHRKENPDQQMLPKDIMEPMLNDVMPMQMLGMFYLNLTNESKDPAYYGETVTPEDTGKVLMRWKESDTTYKVIFGDLSIEEVSAEQLAELEAQSFDQ